MCRAPRRKLWVMALPLGWGVASLLQSVLLPAVAFERPPVPGLAGSCWAQGLFLAVDQDLGDKKQAPRKLI